MRAEIKALQRETGVTTVFVTHDQVEAMTMGDRIAVMQAGVLEQLGDPDEVYNRPANVFVASFIGSPAMTFGRFAVSRENGRMLLRAGPIELDHDGLAEGAPGEVIAGVRPEHVRPWQADSDLLGPFSGRVESVEALGRETFVGVQAGDGLEYVVRFDGAVSRQIGEPLEFGIERGRVFLFDPASKAAIGH
jgi:ABC-type sugar transport system ATPase subunit